MSPPPIPDARSNAQRGVRPGHRDADTDRPRGKGIGITVESDTPVAPIQARAFAAGTAIRFALLLAFITVDSLYLLSVGASWYRSRGGEWFELCRLAVGHDPMQPYRPVEAITYAAWIESCDVAHGLRAPGAWMPVGAVAVVGVATAIYLLWPRWRCRRGRLLPIDLSSSDELAQRLRELVAVAGLRRTPGFVIDPRADTVSAVVFGRLGRYTVCLDAGLVARSAAGPDVLRDVVLHELAHIRNRDVDITYATVALWRAFLLCVLLPHLVGQAVSLATDPELWRAEWQLGLRGLLRVAILVALTYLVRADILRNREFYADLDAANLAGRTAFSWRTERPGGQPRFAGRQRFLGLWRTHPAAAARVRSLRDPGILFGATALPMFLTGVIAQVTSVTLPLVVEAFGLSWGFEATREVSTWLTAVLVVGIAGYALWRAVAYNILAGRHVPAGWGAGVWLGVGMAVGELVSFRTAGSALLPPDPELLLVFVITGPVFTWWVTQCAELWIRGCRGRSIRSVQFLGLAAALVVFGTWYGYWMSGPFLLLIGPLHSLDLLLPGLPPWFWVIADLGNRPLVVVGAAVLWLFPLLALVRKPGTETPGWVRRARTDAPDHDSTVHRPVSLRPAAVAAVLGGALSCAAVVIVMLALHPDQPPVDQRFTAAWIYGYPMWLMAGLGAAMVATAIIVSATTVRYRLAMALAASGGAGLLGLLGLFAFASVDGCLAPMRVMGYACSWRPYPAWLVVTQQVPFVLGLGITLAAIGALIGAVLAESGRRLINRRPAPASRDAERPESLIVRRLVVAAVCTAVAVLAANTARNYYVRDDPAVDAVATLGREAQRTPDMISRQVWAWLKVGGHDRITKLSQDFRQWGVAAGDAVRAAEQAGQPTVDVDSAVFLPICTAIVRDADDAAQFIPIPDAEAQDEWAKTHLAAAQAGSDCRNSLQTNDDALFDKSMNEGLTAVTAYEALLRRLDAVGALETGP
ncbi:M48 family metallopeptidase [Nocardia sp. XZ_19_369]|uniref:M48 family metallopeptidase n=1 Tax=Nocardia sp. XZ_19_369 TaxID=2769487 RepID=UPI00188EAD1F|nr:M48 family metalloprotease [Nocardia sp. XZ_19_369]